MEEEMNNGLTSESEYASIQAGTAASRMSKGPAMLNKLKSQQSKIKAKATAISNIIGHSDITSNPKAVATAGIVWFRIEIAKNGTTQPP